MLIQELGNYAEYSGAPSTAETYVFAKTLLNWCAKGMSGGKGNLIQDVFCCLHRCGSPTAAQLLPCTCSATANPDGRRRALVVGGGIANFTSVSSTFTGMCLTASRSCEAVPHSKQGAPRR